MPRSVGIDLGTTNSVVAVLQNGRPEIIPNSEGGKTTPSVVYFDPSGEVVVGDLAKRQRVAQPDRTIYSVKRFMGCRADEVDARLEGIAYKMGSDREGMAVVDLGDRKLRPEDVSAYVLVKMKETAEAYLGEPVTSAVITVPAHFNDSQRTATKLAGERAGLNVSRIVNEPTAAALSFGLTREQKRIKTAVFDFGGGTFDISILDIDGDIVEVKSTGGDTYLGGDNINQILMVWIVDRIRSETGCDPLGDMQALQRIVEAAEKAKCELSTLQKTLISLPFIVSDATGPKHLNVEIGRPEFNELIQPILEGLRAPCDRALADAGLRADQVDTVLLVGGSSRIPAVRDLVRQIFGREPDASMNPDEVVAAGACVQAGVMTGEIEEVLLLDVTPLSLGIELAGNVFAPLIPRNSNIPTTATKRYTTVVDNQSAVRIHVLQGERKIASENRSLGHFKLTGIPPAPKEIPEIEVALHIDANGILTVSAVDQTSGVRQTVEIESYMAGASEAEQALADAARNAEKDRVFIQKADLRRRLGEMEILFKEYRERPEVESILSEDLERRIREAFFKWDVMLAQDDWGLIEEAEREAKTHMMELASLYAAKTGKAAPSRLMKNEGLPQ